jgi:hypothetical protein
MLNKQCPNCGSYNDEKADECYFCHKELPGAKKHKKKSADSTAIPSTRFRAGPPPHMKIGERERPGCVAILSMAFFTVAIYFLLSAFCVFSGQDAAFIETINSSVVSFFYYLAASFFNIFYGFILGWVDRNAMLAVVVLFAISGVALLVGWGLWNTTRWARILFLILLGLLAAGSLVFVVPSLVFKGVSVPDYLRFLPEPILFLLPPVTVLLVIGVSLYPFIWFANNGKYFRH